MRISDWSSDVCSSDLVAKRLFLPGDHRLTRFGQSRLREGLPAQFVQFLAVEAGRSGEAGPLTFGFEQGKGEDAGCNVSVERGQWRVSALPEKLRVNRFRTSHRRSLDRKSTRLNSSH